MHPSGRPGECSDRVLTGTVIPIMLVEDLVVQVLKSNPYHPQGQGKPGEGGGDRVHSGPLRFPRSGGREPGSLPSPKPVTIGEIKDHQSGSGKTRWKREGEWAFWLGGTGEGGGE